MTTWEDQAKTIIASVHEDLPETATMEERRAACLAAKPHEFASTSWGKKTWAKAQRAYLVKYGYVPKNAQPIPLLAEVLSPLQRARERALRS